MRLKAIASALLLCSASALLADTDTDAYANRLRGNYGAPSLRSLGSGHSEGYRVWIVNSTGRDVLMLTAVKRPGQLATLTMVNARNHRSLTTRLPDRVWLDLVRRGKGFEKVAPRPDPESPDTPLCLDSWGSLAEAIDARGRIRRSYGDACLADVAWKFVVQFDQLAIAQLPGCKWLIDSRFGELTFPLDVCTLLTGNRKAAAQAALWLNDKGLSTPFATSDPLDDLLSDNVVAHWRGRDTLHGRYDVGAALLEDFDDWDVKTDWIRGLASDRVALYVTLDQSRMNLQPGAKPVPLVLTFKRKVDGDLELIRIDPR